MEHANTQQLPGEPQEFITVGRGKFKSWWDSQEGLVRFRGVGKIGKEFAKRDVAEVLKIANQYAKGKDVSILANATLTPSFPSMRAMRVYQESLKNPHIKKIAMFGVAPGKRFVINSLMQIVRIKNMRAFGCEQEAFKWLKEKR